MTSLLLTVLRITPVSCQEAQANARNALAKASAWRVVCLYVVMGLLGMLGNVAIDTFLPENIREVYQTVAQFGFLAITATLLYLLTRALVGHLVVVQDQMLSEGRAVMARLAHAAEFRDECTASHLERIGDLVMQTALAYGMTGGQALCLSEAAKLHDIGKIGVPDRILLKPGQLTPEERWQMQRHVEIGADLLSGSNVPHLQTAHTVALTHHERWDGSGYPRGLSGSDIPIEGRIVAVCDVFDALVSPRPYKPAWSVAQAAAEIHRLSGIQFDPKVVAAFERGLRTANLQGIVPDASADPAVGGVAGNLQA